MDHNGLSDEEFWNHRGNSKETYLNLASKILYVEELLPGGSSLDYIKNGDYLRVCPEQYFELNNMIGIYRYGEK